MLEKPLQCLYIKRLADDFIHSSIFSFLMVLAAGVSSDANYLWLVLLVIIKLFDSDGRFQTVHHRHIKVCENDLETVAILVSEGYELQSLLTVDAEVYLLHVYLEIL